MHQISLKKGIRHINNSLKIDISEFFKYITKINNDRPMLKVLSLILSLIFHLYQFDDPMSLPTIKKYKRSYKRFMRKMYKQSALISSYMQEVFFFNNRF